MPTWMYHRTLPPKLVMTDTDLAALGPEWADTPAAFQVNPPPPVPVPEADVVPRPKRRREIR